MLYSLLQQFEFFKLPFLIICFDKYYVYETTTKKRDGFQEKKIQSDSKQEIYNSLVAKLHMSSK